MSTRISTNLFHHARILLIVVLCAIVAGSVFADGRNDRSRDDDSNRKETTRHERSNKDERSKQNDDKQASERKDSTDKKPVYGNFNPNQRGRWDSDNKSTNDSSKSSTYRPSSDNSKSSTYKPGSDDSRNSTNKPTDNYRSRQFPGTASSRSNDWQNNRNNRDDRDNHDYRPNSSTRHDSDTRDYRNSDKKQVITYKRTRDNDNNYRPASYKPPVYRGGYYYYSSHPNYKPCRYGYWVDHDDSRFTRRSVYFHYGFFKYVQIARIHITPYISIAFYNRPISYDTDYYLVKRNNARLNDALSDIRLAWINGRSDLLDDHIDRDQRIAVLLDGRYDYSIDSDDYAQMTFDAIDEVETVSFNWTNVRQHINGDFTAYGKHTYYDSYNDLQTVYVSYTLTRIGSDYIITEVGSSTSPLI